MRDLQHAKLMTLEHTQELHNRSRIIRPKGRYRLTPTCSTDPTTASGPPVGALELLQLHVQLPQPLSMHPQMAESGTAPAHILTSVRASASKLPHEGEYRLPKPLVTPARLRYDPELPQVSIPGRVPSKTSHKASGPVLAYAANTSPGVCR
jgi:hypothetical protein